MERLLSKLISDGAVVRVALELDKAADDAMRRSPNCSAAQMLFETADRFTARPITRLTKLIASEKAESKKK